MLYIHNETMKNLNDNSQIPALTANTSPLKTLKPIYWKQVMMTTFTVYPLILTAQWFLNLLFPMQVLMPEVALFIGVTVVASLLVFPIMPLVTKFLGPWLYKK